MFWPLLQVAVGQASRQKEKVCGACSFFASVFFFTHFLACSTEALPLSSSSPSSSPTPWDSWELDPTFFRALSQWTLDHPESSLDRVLEYVCVGIDEGKEFLQLVPNSPFPARGLIGALAHLVKLGVVCGSASLSPRACSMASIDYIKSHQGGSDV